jgi:hypothetical protein
LLMPSVPLGMKMPPAQHSSRRTTTGISCSHGAQVDSSWHLTTHAEPTPRAATPCHQQRVQLLGMLAATVLYVENTVLYCVMDKYAHDVPTCNALTNKHSSAWFGAAAYVELSCCHLRLTELIDLA